MAKSTIMKSSFLQKDTGGKQGHVWPGVVVFILWLFVFNKQTAQSVDYDWNAINTLQIFFFLWKYKEIILRDFKDQNKPSNDSS